MVAVTTNAKVSTVYELSTQNKEFENRLKNDIKGLNDGVNAQIRTDNEAFKKDLMKHLNENSEKNELAFLMDVEKANNQLLKDVKEANGQTLQDVREANGRQDADLSTKLEKANNQLLKDVKEANARMLKDVKETNDRQDANLSAKLLAGVKSMDEKYKKEVYEHIKDIVEEFARGELEPKKSVPDPTPPPAQQDVTE